MPKTPLDRIKDLEARQGGGTSGGGTVTIIGGGNGVGTTRLNVYVDSELIGTERGVNFVSTQEVSFSAQDDPSNDLVTIFANTSPAATRTPGLIDVGAGMAAGSGYTLSSTTGSALDLNNDLPLPADAGQLFTFDFAGRLSGGTGKAYFDILSVNSGLYAGDGISGAGWPSLQTPASQITPVEGRAWYITTNDDVDPGTKTATFRIMYRVDGGTSTLYTNDTDGHFRVIAQNVGAVVPVFGQNTGQPPVTPPAAGGVTDRGTTTVSGVTSNVNIVSLSFHPATGSVLLAVDTSFLATATTAPSTPTDTFGDSGGAHTGWTKTTGASTFSGHVFSTMWTRTVGNGATTGSITVARTAGSQDEGRNLDILELTGWTETPVQTGAAQLTNVTSFPQNYTKPGSGVGTANDLLVATLFNPDNNVAGPTVPTEGGAWVTDNSSQLTGDGHGLAHLIGSIASTLTWTGLGTGSSFPNLATYAVFTPSGTSTAAPGTESWTHANSTSSIDADMNWEDMTI